MKNKILTVLFIISLSVFALTLSIAVPIYCRFIYFMQIEPLNLVEVTGYSEEVIKTAYNEMINYLTMPNAPFSTGILKYSESGASHFQDVKKLFDLNAVALIVSLITSVTLIILNAKKVVIFHNFFGVTPYFISAIVNVAVPLIIGLFAVIDFEAVFDLFHAVAFPGKTDWLFNPSTDEIIKILPMEFFATCAAVIGVTLILVSIIYLIVNAKILKNKNQKSN